MILIPGDDFILKSRLSAEACTARLYDVVHEGSFFSMPQYNSKVPRHKIFKGSIGDGKFLLYQILYTRRNSFAPVITGAIEGNSFGSLVKVKLRLRVAVRIFLIIWITGVSFATLAIFISMLNSGEFTWAVFSPLIMYVFAFGITQLGYNYERKQILRQFNKIFEAEVQ